MWYKKLVNYYVFVLSILTVNLLSDKLTSWILNLRFMAHPVKATAIGMGVLVFILYPAYHYIEKWSEQFAKRVFKVGRNAGGKFFGVTLAFLLCLAVLFVLYLQLWWGWDEVGKQGQVVLTRMLGG